MLRFIPLLPLVGFLINLSLGRRLTRAVSGVTGPLRAGAALGVVLMAELIWAIVRAGEAPDSAMAGGAASNVDAMGSVRALGQLLFTEYAFAFEVTSILIVVAMVGAVVLAKREL